MDHRLYRTLNERFCRRLTFHCVLREFPLLRSKEDLKEKMISVENQRVCLTGWTQGDMSSSGNPSFRFDGFLGKSFFCDTKHKNQYPAIFFCFFGYYDFACARKICSSYSSMDVCGCLNNVSSVMEFMMFFTSRRIHPSAHDAERQEDIFYLACHFLCVWCRMANAEYSV